LQNDLVYLLKLWQVVVRRIRRLKAPVEVFRETDMITRTIRDTFTPDIDTIWVDEPNAYQHAREFLESVMPTYANRLRLYEGTEPLFFKYRIEEEIAKIQNKYVPLPHGGSIVIEQTEALVAIDVNSGNFRADNNPEETAFQINLHAAREIARQLRLRDLGGVIVNDFIDMREERHRRAVEQAMRDAIKRDRARTKVLKISPFGLIEMTRQRIRPSLKKSIYQDCPWCRATGYVKSPESMSLDVMRLLQLAAHREGIHEIVIRVHSEVANYLLNRKRREVVQLEQKGELTITITGLPHVPPETLEITCYDRNGTETRFQPFEPPARLGQRSTPVSSQRSGRDGRDR
jgi:ribonuclease E